MGQQLELFPVEEKKKVWVEQLRLFPDYEKEVRLRRFKTLYPKLMASRKEKRDQELLIVIGKFLDDIKVIMKED